MLELRPNCENCNKALPPESEEARICTFECTFCADCVDNLFQNVCLNCGGGFVPRPIRPKAMLEKFPASTKPVYNSLNINTQKARAERLSAYANIPPSKR